MLSVLLYMLYPVDSCPGSHITHKKRIRLLLYRLLLILLPAQHALKIVLDSMVHCLPEVPIAMRPRRISVLNQPDLTRFLCSSTFSVHSHPGYDQEIAPVYKELFL
ncbi:hypothetical protein D1872_181170 [compost metagenome]